MADPSVGVGAGSLSVVVPAGGSCEPSAVVAGVEGAPVSSAGAAVEEDDGVLAASGGGVGDLKLEAGGNVLSTAVAVVLVGVLV